MKATLFIVAALCSACAASAAPAQAQQTLEAKHTAQVERGLLPPYVTERTKPMLLSDRMHHYKVPAISVAVVDNGKLAWAKAWGEAQVGQGQPVTTKTLFQAASISKPLAALALAATPIYLRGSLNDWGLSLPMRRAAPGRLLTEVDLPAGPISFKFGSDDWRAIDLGAGIERRGGLGMGGPNLRFDAKKAGRYRIELDVRDTAAPSYSVKPLKLTARGRS